MNNKRRVVLDTSVWIAIERGTIRPQDVIQENDEVLIPVVVLTELRTAQYLKKRTSLQRKATAAFIDSLIDAAEIAPIDQSLAETAAKVLAEVIDAGDSISDNDLYVAATARHHHAELVSLDRKAKFEKISGIVLRPIQDQRQKK